jgi:NitT/TauT family transport system permease protein
MSFFRVMAGFLAAMLIGIPFGLLLAVSRTAFGTGFPVFEVLRPIPPLAWVPASILFWPTQEMSIAFVTFLGAFFTIVINVVGGARSIDIRYFQAARSMGSSQSDIFWRIILPGTLPSIMVGSAVGMGITWEVVVAAEMISGGGSQIGGTSGGGLGFFIWNSYVGGSYEQIVVGMISIGIAGFISSELLRALGRRVTPWLRSDEPRSQRVAGAYRAGRAQGNAGEQELRPAARAEGSRQRMLVHHRARQADGHDRTFRLRQEHAHPPARRIREADHRHDCAERRAGHRALRATAWSSSRKRRCFRG